MLSVPAVIHKTRERQQLTKEEIQFFVKSVVDGSAQQSQIGAWLMAVYLNGLTPTETVHLTLTMRDSGELMKWPEDLKVGDKHSTGGIGDKISIILAPALAACGVYVPMISGRGLGHTGGTVDKLESIPGFKCSLPVDQIQKAVIEHGCVMTCQTPQIAPADGVLYKTRDVTETVQSVPLITASILSKKLSAGLKALVMDVKFGRAAFMRTLERARELAKSIQAVANACNVKTSTCITCMDVPIGLCVGNSLETFECIVALQNGEFQRDLEDLVVTEGACLLRSFNLCTSLDDGKDKLREAIRSGKALEKFLTLCKVHGVSDDVVAQIAQIKRFDDLLTQTVFPLAKHRTPILAQRGGFVADIHALEVGYVVFDLGGGRTNSDASIDSSVGIRIIKHVGEAVKEGEEWCELHHQDIPEAKLKFFVEQLQNSITIQDEKPELQSFVKEILLDS